jgi:hypothetical protein
LRCYATFYKARHKAKQRDEQIKRKQARDAAARTVAGVLAAYATPTHKYRSNQYPSYNMHPLSNAKPKARTGFNSWWLHI